jgi:CBS domain-containing protein
MKVNEIMCKDVAWCSLSSSAVAAASIMQERNVGILPVAVDPFTPVLVAVVTDRDLCLYIAAAGKDPAHVWVSGCRHPRSGFLCRRKRCPPGP